MDCGVVAKPTFGLVKRAAAERGGETDFIGPSSPTSEVISCGPHGSGEVGSEARREGSFRASRAGLDMRIASA
jgi:hypothetical protein